MTFLSHPLSSPVTQLPLSEQILSHDMQRIHPLIKAAFDLYNELTTSFYSHHFFLIKQINSNLTEELKLKFCVPLIENLIFQILDLGIINGKIYPLTPEEEGKLKLKDCDIPTNASEFKNAFEMYLKVHQNIMGSLIENLNLNSLLQDHLKKYTHLFRKNHELLKSYISEKATQHSSSSANPFRAIVLYPKYQSNCRLLLLAARSLDADTTRPDPQVSHRQFSFSGQGLQIPEFFTDSTQTSPIRSKKKRKVSQTSQESFEQHPTKKRRLNDKNIRFRTEITRILNQ